MLHNNAMLKYIQHTNKAVEGLLLTICKIQLTYHNRIYMNQHILERSRLLHLTGEVLQCPILAIAPHRGVATF